MTGAWLVLAKIAIIVILLFFVSGAIAVAIDLWLTKKKNRAALSKQPPEESEPQTLTASEIMSLSDVTSPEIETAIATLHELGALFSDNGDSRVEATNETVEMLRDILRETEKRA